MATCLQDFAPVSSYAQQQVLLFRLMYFQCYLRWCFVTPFCFQIALCAQCINAAVSFMVFTYLTFLCWINSVGWCCSPSLLESIFVCIGFIHETYQCRFRVERTKSVYDFSVLCIVSVYLSCPTVLHNIFHTTMAWYSLFVLKVPLNTNKSTSHHTSGLLMSCMHSLVTKSWIFSVENVTKWCMGQFSWMLWCLIGWQRDWSRGSLGEGPAS